MVHRFLILVQPLQTRGSPVQTGAGFLLKPRAHHVTFMIGPAQGITDHDFLTYIYFFVAEPVDTKVIRIIEAHLIQVFRIRCSLIPLEMMVGSLHRNLEMSLRDWSSFKAVLYIKTVIKGKVYFDCLGLTISLRTSYITARATIRRLV